MSKSKVMVIHCDYPGCTESLKVRLDEQCDDSEWDLRLEELEGKAVVLDLCPKCKEKYDCN